MLEALPSGTVTFLFTDIEGSTRMLREVGARYRELRNSHHDLIRLAVRDAGGIEVDAVGDGFFAAFPTPISAVDAAVSAQRAMAAHTWADLPRPRVRMGVHTGQAETDGRTYVGLDVHLAARIAAAAHGDQIVISESTRMGAVGGLPPGVRLRPLGAHRLRGIAGTVTLHDLEVEGLPGDFPPLRTLGAATNLPAELTSFVGRRAELLEIAALLRTARLVTLTGPGGSGKTRLATRAADSVRARYADGVVFVGLADAHESESMLAAVNRVLGISGGLPSLSLLDQLARHLEDRQLLLVLDNLEQVSGAGPTIAALLSRCAGVSVLGTSRESLDVRGENRLAVHPLALPAADGPMSVEALRHADAVRLFIDRAREVQRTFSLTAENASAVGEICRRLDGLPLAIELACARLSVFSPIALASRLGTGLDVSDTGPQDLPERQRTLRSCISWSYELLDPDERRLFEVISVFATADLEAIEQVTARVPSLGRLDAIGTVASLADQSLVQVVDGASGHTRLAMLETIRAFGAERIQQRTALERQVRAAHAAHYADAAERLARTGEIVADSENLEIAWRHCLETRDVPRLEKLAAVFSRQYELEGRYRAKVRMLHELLRLLELTPDTKERTNREILLQGELGRSLLAIHGYTEDVHASYERVLELTKSAGMPQEALPGLALVAGLHVYSGNFARATEVGREIVALASEHGEVEAERDGHMLLGMSVGPAGDVRRGLEHIERAIALSAQVDPAAGRQLGYNRMVSTLGASAFYLWLLGYPERAKERAGEATAAATNLGHPLSVAHANFHAGLLRYWMREFDEAADYAGRVLETVEGHDFAVWHALALCLLGASDASRRAAPEGLATFEEGYGRYQTIRAPPLFYPMLVAIRSATLAHAGRTADALAAADEAIAMGEAGSARAVLPEFYLLKGFIQATTGSPDAAQTLVRAHDLAAAMELAMPRLRAAVALCRVRAATGAREQGIAILQPAYSALTEGFDTVDVMEAAALLEQPS